MKRAVGYIRVSTEEQSREGISLEMQAAKIRAYAELNDLELVDTVEDAGISGKSIKARPGIQAVLKMVEARKIDAVIVYKLDRLARNTIECLNMAEGMDKAGCALHSISRSWTLNRRSGDSSSLSPRLWQKWREHYLRKNGCGACTETSERREAWGVHSLWL